MECLLRLHHWHIGHVCSQWELDSAKVVLRHLFSFERPSRIINCPVLPWQDCFSAFADEVVMLASEPEHCPVQVGALCSTCRAVGIRGRSSKIACDGKVLYFFLFGNLLLPLVKVHNYL